jgi:hypothetical protein
VLTLEVLKAIIDRINASAPNKAEDSVVDETYLVEQIRLKKLALHDRTARILRFEESAQRLASVKVNIDTDRRTLIARRQDRDLLQKHKEKHLMPDFLAMVKKECGRHTTFHTIRGNIFPVLWPELERFMQQTLVLQKHCFPGFIAPAEFSATQIDTLTATKQTFETIIRSLKKIMEDSALAAHEQKTPLCNEAEDILQLVSRALTHVNTYLENRELFTLAEHDIIDRKNRLHAKESKYIELNIENKSQTKLLQQESDVIQQELNALETQLAVLERSKKKSPSPFTTPSAIQHYWPLKYNMHNKPTLVQETEYVIANTIAASFKK